MSKVSTSLGFEGRLLRVELDAPKANILDTAMVESISDSLRAHASEPLRAIVFSGAGDHFSFGASVLEHTAPHVRGMLTRFHGLFHQMLELSVPTFAVVRGQCLGGGLELAAFTNGIFSAPNARFGQPEINLAVFPPLASVLLPWRIGGAHAMDLCVSGRTIGAEEAARVGLIRTIDSDPMAAFETFFADHVVDKSPTALRYAERAARMGLARALREDLPQLESIYLDGLMKSHDANEGLAAFLEKRKPRFSDAIE